MKICYLFLLCIFISGCKKQPLENRFPEGQKTEVDSVAINLNNEGIGLYHKAMSDSLSFVKAIECFDKAIAIDSTYKLAYTNKAKYLNAIKGDTEAALLVLSQAQCKKPEDPQLYFMQGVLNEKMNRREIANGFYKTSLMYHDKLVKKKPDNFGILLDRAVTQFILDGDSVKAFAPLFKKYKDNPEMKEQLDFFQKIFSMGRDSLVKEIGNWR